MANSAIGPFNFIAMSKPPEGPNQRLALETRAGVNGTSVWKIGDGGQPFQIRTTADAANFAAAVALFRSYEAAIGTGPVGLIFGGVGMNYLVAILDVSPDDVAATAIGVGGLLGSSNAIVRATWKLLPWRV